MLTLSIGAISIGDRAPAVLGTGANGRLYAEDAQIGRPAMLVALGAVGPDTAGALKAGLMAARAALAHEVDVVALTPALATYAAALAGAGELVVHLTQGEELSRVVQDGAPAVIVLDRAWRVVAIAPYRDDAALVALYARLRPRLAAAPPRRVSAPAPVLIVPNVVPPEICRGLMAHFELSPHRAGLMASAAADGAALARYDEGKKRRRDLELHPDQALHGEVLKVLAERCAPEIKRAFQFDVAFADRILIARYDDTGGYFKRHRDNLAPQVAFRDFAVSMNLNTGDYEGGALVFPEFSDDLYDPPAGSAAIFSASLLHEATPIVRGRRYVALSFLSGADSQARAAHAG